LVARSRTVTGAAARSSSIRPRLRGVLASAEQWFAQIEECGLAEEFDVVVLWCGELRSLLALAGFRFVRELGGLDVGAILEPDAEATEQVGAPLPRRLVFGRYDLVTPETRVRNGPVVVEDGGVMGVSSASPQRRRRWRWVGLGAAVLIGLVVFVLVWFQPQKLWIDERVSEAPPSGNAAAPAARSGHVEVARGQFVSREHETAGVVSVLRLADGSRVARLEGLVTSNGPDLHVYLSSNRAEGPEGAFDDEYVSLGGLKGNLGDQNYVVPTDVDLARFATLVIWCDRFDAAFGAADLTLA
jgi:hypothetical protein